MSFTTFKRMLKAGYFSFIRNGWLSCATIMIMTTVLFVIGCLIFLGAFGTAVLSSLESKIDISMYFVADANEQQIFDVKKTIEERPEIKEVSYVSREDALNAFKERHKGNELIDEALAELGGNPLVASLNIKAHDSSHYAAISKFLTEQHYPIVEKINYFENQTVIERLNAIIQSVRIGGVAVAAVFTFIAVLVAFNTIRLAIYTMRDEIHIMRLVGATSWFIRGPFLLNGILYGTIAAVLAILLFFPLWWIITPRIGNYIPNFNPFEYLLANVWSLFLMLFVFGTVLGVFSSFIAIRRYLRV